MAETDPPEPEMSETPEAEGSESKPPEIDDKTREMLGLMSNQEEQEYDSRRGIPFAGPSEDYLRRSRIQNAYLSGQRPDPEDLAEEAAEKIRYQGKVAEAFERKRKELESEAASQSTVAPRVEEVAKEAAEKTLDHSKKSQAGFGSADGGAGTYEQSQRDRRPDPNEPPRPTKTPPDSEDDPEAGLLRFAQRPLFLAGVGIVVTILALIFWGVLFFLAALVFILAAYQEKFFERSRFRWRLRIGLYAAIGLAFFVAWRLLPRPAILEELLTRHYPSSIVPTPTPTTQSFPAPSLKPDWKASDEAKQLASQILGGIQDLIDEGKLIDLADYRQAVKGHATWVEKCSIALGRVDIQIRRFTHKDSDYKNEFDESSVGRNRISSNENLDRELLRNDIKIALGKLESIKKRAALDTMPDSEMIRLPL